MNKKRNLRLKKFYFHPVFTFIFLIVLTVLLSFIISKLQIQSSYSQINPTTMELESKLVSVENLLNYNGLKYMISNAAKNFAGFTPLSNLLIALIGLSIAYSSGLIDAFTRRITLDIDNKKITFIILLLATISSLINEIGYVILIPLSAIIFSANKRNPLLGIITAYCGVAFGYGTTLFVGTLESELIPSTTLGARLIDPNYHVPLTSNLYIMIITCIILSIVGTIIIEKLIAPKFIKIKVAEVEDITKEINIEKIKETEQNKIEINYREKKGLKKALIITIVFLVVFAYMLIPGLPFSGLLLDLSENTYLKQVFGENSYFQDGFTYMISLLFAVTGLAYAIGAKSISSTRELMTKAIEYFNNTGELIITLFFASQFISIFKKSNIGMLILSVLTKIISSLSFSGIPLIILFMVIVAVSGLFVTAPNIKWNVLSPVIIPMMMQSNISPQFCQFIFRAADSMTKGITPLLAYFAIFISYLNIYNTEKENITIKKAISYVMPYCLIILATWMVIIIGWYILGAPIGPGSSSTL